MTILPRITNQSHGKVQSTSITVSHISDGLPLYVFTGAWQRDFTTVTFNGVGLTLLGQDATNNLRTMVWRLLTPGIVTANIVASHGGAAEGLALAGMNIGGVTAEGTPVSAKGSTNSPTVTVPSDVDSIVVGNLVYHSSNYHAPKMTPPNFQLQSFLVVNDVNVKIDASFRNGVASTDLGWDSTVVKEWAMIALSLKGTPASGGAYASA